MYKRQEVRLEGTMSSFFENKTRFKEGDPLSPILINLALQIPSGIKIGKEQLDVLAYADDTALIVKNEI